jgi:O-antigen ligase
MQIAGSNRMLPPSGGSNTPDSATELERQQMRQRRILLLRTAQLWWYPILLVVLGGLVATILGQFAMSYPLYIFGVLCGLPFIFMAVRRLEFGLFFVALIATPLSPLTVSLKSLEVDPPVLLLLALFAVFILQTAFHTRDKPVLPSIWVRWPLFGLLILAVISNLFIQINWAPNVPHKLNNSPILVDEIYGVCLFTFPLLVTTMISAAITGKERWIGIIVHTYLIVAVVAATIVTFEFRRIGADIYTFRYTEPTIGWMSLRGLAHILVLGSIIAYVHFLCTPGSWRMRITYGVITVMCLASVYFTLENSWWLEAGIALMVITIVYSRRLTLFFCVLSLPFIPFLRGELTKLQTVKSVDIYRLTIWQDSLRVWSKQPFLGVGPGNFWPYDQVFTQLPRYVRDFNKTGLGVAHNGYLQMLGEMGPLGLFLMLACIVVIIIAAARLYRRSNTPQTLNDRILALICLGLVCGSTVADFVSGGFFLSPRQIGSAKGLPQLTSTWIIYGLVMYKDQLWRLARRGVKTRAGAIGGTSVEENDQPAIESSAAKATHE